MSNPTPISEDSLPLEEGEDGWDDLTSEAQEAATDFWMEHQRCEACLDVFQISDGDYTEGQGRFYCTSCMSEKG